MTRCVVLVGLLGAIGCDGTANTHSDAIQADAATPDAPPPVFHPFWTSGTRLRARLWTPLDGGDPIFGGWRDTLLDTDCENAIAADGVERCMPVHARIETEESYAGGAVYADAACTQKLAIATAARCGRDRYAVTSATKPTLHAFPVGAVYTGPIWSNPGCTQRQPYLGVTLYPVGSTEEPATSFAATERYMTLVGGFLHEQYGFGDGSTLDLGILATESGSCRPDGGISSGTTACGPTSRAPALQLVFSDAACTRHALLAWRPGGPKYPPQGTVARPFVSKQGQCPTAFTVWTAAYDPPWKFSFGDVTYYDGSCTAQHTDGWTKLYDVTPSPPQSQFPTGTLAPTAPNGRLGYLMWTGPDGAAIPVANWDHQLGRACFALVGNDGAFRCLPPGGDGTCNGQTPVHYVGDYSWETPTGPSCDLQGVGNGWSVEDSAGQTVDPSTFAALHEVIE